MKKIITLLLAAGAFATASAQTTKDEARKVILGGDKKGADNNTTRGRDVILGDGNGNTTNYPSSTSRDAEIDRINRDYDSRIIATRNNPNLSTEEKERIIRDLEKERQRKIKQVNNRYENRDDNDRNDAKKNKKAKKAKSNNGKHLGWEKGKGNPHKNGGTPGKGKGKKS